MPTEQRRRLVRSQKPAEEYDEEPVAPQRRLRREEPPTTLRSSRRHPTEEPPARSHRATNRRTRNTDEADDDRGLAVAKGWSGYRRTKANAPSPFTKLYKVQDDEQLIMFLEDEPYASFLMHWCDWVPRGQRMSYICLQENCPLDEVDPKPQARVRFNILDCAGDTPILVTFECGYSVTESLNGWAESDPLSGRYFAVQMTGAKNNRRTQIRPIKIRDLEEDWEWEPLTEEDISKFDDKLWDETSLDVASRDELQKVADSFTE